MKTLRQSVAICLTLTAIVLFSCKKNHDAPAPEKPADSTVFHINYIYLATASQIRYDSVKEFELILSEANGSVLLDTIAPVNASIIADIKTIQKNLDLTVIIYRPVAKAWYMTTEKAINPTDWSILPGSDSIFGAPPNIIPNYTFGTVLYTHVPVSSNEPYMWGDYPANTQHGLYKNPGDNGLPIYFLQPPGDDVYLSFPNKGLYNFHHMTGALDTVDLSKMDTAVRIRFNRPAQYPQLTAYLNGFVDPTDLSKNMHISHYITGTDTIVGADLVYPGKRLFKKYNFSLSFSSADRRTSIGYSNYWCDSVTPNPVLLDDSYSTLSSTTNNNFAVQFNKQHPGYYTTQWGSPKMYLTMQIPSDSTILHTVDFLTALKSKMLKGQDLNTLMLQGFSFNYNVDQNVLVPVKLTQSDYHYHLLSEKPVQTYYSKYWY